MVDETIGKLAEV